MNDGIDMTLNENEIRMSHTGKKSCARKDLPLPGEKPLEIDENDDIVTTLFAKPGESSPLLNLQKLKNGVYEETSFLSLRSYLLFTDIGREAMKAASELNSDTQIELVKSSLLEEDKSWQVLITNPDIRVLINSIRFKPMGKFTSTFYLSIDISSKPAPLLAFVRELTENLKRNPWENESGELDWSYFIKKTSCNRDEVIDQWSLLSGLLETSEEMTEVEITPLCRSCEKELDEEWIVCPYCGEPKSNEK
jgi:hypothetical protein